MQIFLRPRHPVRCINTSPSESGKSVSLTNLTLNSINEFEKLYNYPPCLHQDIYQKLFNCYYTFIRIHIFANFLNDKNIDIVFDEIVNDKDFEKSDVQKEMYETLEEIKCPQESEYGGINRLDDLHEKELNNPRVQAMFRRYLHKNLSIFIITQDYYELPEKTIRTNGIICHIFEPSNYRDA